MSTSQSSARPNSRDDAFSTGVFSVGAFSSSIRSADQNSTPVGDRPSSSRSADRLNRTTETPRNAGQSTRISNEGQRRRQRGSENGGRPAGQSQPRQGAPRQGAQGQQRQGAPRQGAQGQQRQGGQRQNAPARRSNRPAVVEAHSDTASLTGAAFPVAAQRVAVVPGEPTKTFAELGVPAALVRGVMLRDTPKVLMNLRRESVTAARA